MTTYIRLLKDTPFHKTGDKITPEKFKECYWNLAKEALTDEALLAYVREQQQKADHGTYENQTALYFNVECDISKPKNHQTNEPGTATTIR